MNAQKSDGKEPSNDSRLARIMAQLGKRGLAGRICALRRAKGLSQHQLATKAGIHLRCVITVEDGCGVTEGNLQRMLSVLRAKPNDLLPAD